MVPHEASLTLQERVRATLELGESHFREFKSALEGPPGDKKPRDKKTIRRDIGEALVAFANADGGELLVGVEDDGRVTGIRHDDAVIESFLDAWRTHVHGKTPLPTPRIANVTIDGQSILYFSVEKGTALIHLTNDGRCLQRRDRETVPVPSEQIRFERQERLSREYDRTYVDGGDASALDLEAVERIGEQIAPGLSPEKVLQLLDLADFSGAGVRLRRAAVLLLAKEVTRWHPRCEVRVLRVAGTELKAGREYNVVSDKPVSGCILDLLSKAWEEIRPYLVETRLGPDGRFEEQVRYPEDACREALTNAIGHRDYSIEGRAIEVYVFDDRLEVRSPGSLLSTVTVEGIRSLEGVHQSRNTTIARTLRELGYMREMGEGFRRIFQLMRAHDLVEPEIHSDAQSFVVSLRHQSVFSEEDQRWIAAYEHFELERDEEKTLLLGRHGHPLSVKQIMDALDLVDTEDYRALIERLQQKGLIVGVARKAQRGGRPRTAPRWKVVQPREANRFYSELVIGAQAAYRGTPFTKRDWAHIGEFVSCDSPYNPERGLFPTFTRLGLLDPGGNPVGRLRTILETAPEPRDVAAHGSTKDGAVGPVEPADKRRPRRRRRVDPEESSDALLPADPTVTAEDLDADGETVEPPIGERTKLFVGNLAWESTESDLEALFRRVGPVAEVGIPSDFGRQGRNLGYGFVTMTQLDDAKRAKSELEGAELRGRRVYLEWAKSRSATS